MPSDGALGVAAQLGVVIVVEGKVEQVEVGVPASVAIEYGLVFLLGEVVEVVGVRTLLAVAVAVAVVGLREDVGPQGLGIAGSERVVESVGRRA